MRKFVYKILIEFNKSRPECKTPKFFSRYSGSQGNTDEFCFNKKSLTIIANRTHKYEDGTILSSIENTINSQILKGLLFYCSIAKDLPIIKNVSIHLFKNDQLVYIYKETSNFKQPFKTSVQKSYSFTPKQLEILFDSSKKASTLRIALSYWLKSQDTTSSFIKFTYLWRAFGRIYLYQGNSKSETTGQINIRNLIISSANILTNSLSLASNITQNMLNLFRWKKLVIHEYEDRSKMPALKDFIQRYKDGRIMISINDIIDVRKDYLINYEKKGIKQDLWNGPDGVKIWLLNNFQSREDVEILTILCIKYAYFLRNQYFHGEIPDRNFRLKPTTEDKEQEIINELLECLIYELIINHHILR